MIRSLLVDDEPLAREGLRLRLEGEPDIELVGEAANGPEAVRQIVALLPDLVFLDVQMPGMDGFGVLEAVAAEVLPLVVFVTAYDSYALRAFEVHALDYLLKPIGEERLHACLARARRLLRAEAGPPADRPAHPGRQALARLLDAADPDLAPLRSFVISTAGRFRAVRAEDVEWIGAAGNYVELHLPPQNSALVRMTLSEVARRLDPVHFARIHRSAIVNLERIERVLPEWHGDSEVILRSGTRVKMSRTYRQRVRWRDGNEAER